MSYKFYEDSSKKISFWIEEGFAFYSSFPFLEYYLKNGYRIFLYIRRDITLSNHPLLKNSKIRIIIIEDLNAPYICRLILQFFKIFLTKTNFSTMYKRDFKKNNALIFRILNFIFSINIKNVNRYYQKATSLVFEYKFRSFVIYAFTKISTPFFFASKQHKVILVMESWDHIEKSPTFIYPYSFLTWNKSLSNDAKTYQGYKNVNISYPSKVRYADSLNRMKNEKEIHDQIKNNLYIKDLNKIDKKKIFLYPPSYTSIDSKVAFEEESKLILSLSTSLDNETYIFLKPKPTGPRGDYDFLRTNKKIIIGEYASSQEKFEMLDEDYNKYRFLLMKKSKVIINLVTTFALDAALAGVPILQLKLNSNDYPNLTEFQKNAHVSKYLLSQKNIFEYDGVSNININSDLLKNCEEYSQMLKEWCLNKT